MLCFYGLELSVFDKLCNFKLIHLNY